MEGHNGHLDALRILRLCNSGRAKNVEDTFVARFERKLKKGSS